MVILVKSRDSLEKLWCRNFKKHITVEDTEILKSQNNDDTAHRVQE